jgi:hypothetical protein
MQVELGVTIMPETGKKVVAVRRKDDKVLIARENIKDIHKHPDWFKWDITTTVMLPWEKHMDWTIEGLGTPQWMEGGN